VKLLGSGNVKLHSSCASEEGNQRHIENKGETHVDVERGKESKACCVERHILASQTATAPLTELQ
jgi:hypothetical protein